MATVLAHLEKKVNIARFPVSLKLEEVIQMTEDLRMKVSDYRTAILIFQKMLEEGIINEDDYSGIDTILVENIGLNSDTIFH